MAKKKETEQQPSDEEQVLEERVDAMMETRADEPSPFVGPRESLPAEELKSQDDLPPLDIFAGVQSAPELPKDLQKETDVKEFSKAKPPETLSEDIAEPTEPAKPEPQPITAVNLDDVANDAAVDDIVAHEGDDPDDLLDDAEEINEPVHKHRLRRFFWVLITVIAVVAIVTALLAATGGNLNFPGGRQLQNWFNSISDK